MFPLFRKSFLFPSSSGCSSLLLSQVSTLLIRFQVREFSSSSSSHRQPPCKQLEEENVRVSVWWNFDDCRVPSRFSVWKIAPSIRRTVRANGIKTPIIIDIRAYGDVYQFSRFQRIALFLSGIHLRHVSPGWGPAGWELIEDLYSWCWDNPPPIHLFVISGDDDGDSPYVMQYLHKFRMRNYNMLVACPKASQVLEATTAATILWQWSSILKGEDLAGKHFNCPPDGPFDSWYGDLKLPLENPFSALEEPASSENALGDKSASTQNAKVSIW